MNEEAIFHAVLAKPPEERAAFLDQACGGDAALRRQVEVLLQAHDNPGSFLAKPAVKPAETCAEQVPLAMPPEPTVGYSRTERVGTLIAGRFKLLEQIGEGGMGTVWVAEQMQPIRRKVALKLIKAGMDSKTVLARFEAERQALALMDHPNIARVLDGGTTESGRPFFAMEYVKGIPLTKYCDDIHLTIVERLALFVPICHAVQHAHQKGIIHRDLKPSNILVCLYDGQPVPKVIDFGLAKALHQSLTEHTLHTAHGMMMGTPLYMSPEQAEINNLDVDTRTDIYSLGVILYELLTGTTPLEGQRFKEAAWQEMLRVIKEEDPPKPSTRLSGSRSLVGLAAQRKLEPVRLTRLIRGELDWIVMKALEKDRGRRYETANGFARDIQRYLADETVEACPPSAGYRVRKFVRKHRATLLTAAAIVLLLVAGVAASTLLAVRAIHAQTAAQQAEEAAAKERDKALKAEAEAKFQETLAKKNEQAAVEQERETKKQQNEAVKQAKVAKENELIAKKAVGEKDIALKELQYNLAQDQILLAQSAFDSGNSAVAHDRLTQVPAALRRWEWHYLKRLYDGGIFTVYGHTGPVTGVAVSPDGTRFATSSLDQTAKIWNARTGSLLLELKGHTSGVNGVAFSPDGTRVATGSWDQTAKIWDAYTGKALLEFKGHMDGVSSVAFSPDGARLATGSYDKTAKIWDARTGMYLLDLKGHTGLVASVAFNPDGTRLATGSHDNTAKIWDARLGTLLLELKGHSGYVTCVMFSPDGTRLATASNDRSAKIWDARNGTPLLQLKGHNNQVSSLAFSPDGTRLATASNDATAKIWDARTGTPLLELKTHTSDVAGVAFSPDGIHLVTGSYDKTAKIWDAGTGTPLLEFKGHTNSVYSVGFSPDGARLATGSYDKTAKIWDARTGTLVLDLKGHTDQVWSVAFSPDGARLATGSYDNTARIWDARTGMPLLTLQAHSAPVTSVALSPDGTRLATASAVNVVNGDKTAKIWDARTGALQLELKGHMNGICSVAFSPDRTHIATASFDGTAKIWDALTGSLLFDLQVPINTKTSVAFNSDGTRLATGSFDRTVKIWDARTGALLLDLKGNNAAVTSIAFSPDDSRLCTGSADGLAKIWDTRRGMPLLDLKGSGVTSVAFSPDGTRLATGGFITKIWDAGSHEPARDGTLSDKVRDERLFGTRPRPDLDRIQYAKALQAKDTFAANFHVNRLLAAYGQGVAFGSEDLKTLRAVLIQRNHLLEADTVWQKALKLNPPDHDSWYGYAELCLFLGQTEKYQRARQELLERFGTTKNPTTAERTSRACLLLPSTGDDLRNAVALADLAVAAGPKHQFYAFFMAVKGLAEYRQDRPESAAGWLEKAIAGKAAMPSRLVLAMAQHRQGKVEEAAKTLATALASYNWNQAAEGNPAVWISHVLRREAEMLIVPNLAAFLTGDYQPKDNAERLTFVRPCRFQGRFLTAARLLADAFAADPKLADDLKGRHRYNAACYAALVGSSQGNDAEKLDDKERAGWRKQALDWLRADLAVYENQPQSGQRVDPSMIMKHLQNWQKDADLAGIRDQEALAKLSAEEREACRKLWTDVEALLEKVRE